jgi:site-specific DNA recombinase
MAKPNKSNGSAVAYLRLSYVKGDGGTMGEMTLEDQLASCQMLASQRGLTIDKVYNEGQGKSAWHSDNRPQWDKMLAELTPGTTVLGWATSRLSRNADETWRDIDKKGGIVLTADGNNSESLGGKQALAFAAVVDEFYSLRISTQVREGQDRARREGRRLGRRPFGYWSNGGVLTINQEEAAEFRLIAKNMIEGASLRSEAMRLNDKGVPTLLGGKWSPTTIRRMLENKVSMGLLEMPDGELRLIADEQVLDAGTFKEVQNALAKRTRVSFAGPDYKYAQNSSGRVPTSLLSGIATCVTCGRPVGSGKNTNAYRCSGRGAGVCQEGAAHTSKDRTDAYIVTALYTLCLAVQEDPERLSALATAWGTANDPTIEIERKRLEGEIKVHELKLEAMAEKLAKDELTVDSYAAATEAIGKRAQNLRDQLASLVVEDSPVVWVDDVRAALADRIEDIEALDTPDAKKHVGPKGGRLPIRAAEDLLVETFMETAGSLEEARHIIGTVFKSISLKPAAKKYEMFVAPERIEYELAV